MGARLVEAVGVEVEHGVPDLADGVELVEEHTAVELEPDPVPVGGFADELLVGPEGEVGEADVLIVARPVVAPLALRRPELGGLELAVG